MRSDNTTLEEELLLYAVTDRSWLGDRTLYEQVELALKGGATFLQLREKNLCDSEFLLEAKAIQELCREYKVPFIINDNVKVALETDADGIHVGQHDMEAGDVRKLLGEDKILGPACHLRCCQYSGGGDRRDHEGQYKRTEGQRDMRSRCDQRNLCAEGYQGSDRRT